MNVAFYAPMKPPDHAVPSGDRAIARALIAAMQDAGHAVHVASRLRTFDRDGDAAVQTRHAGEGAREAARVAAGYAAATAPDLWLTYHVHHKAPDHVGPPVAQALGIPYVVAEASIAPAQANGRWAVGYRAAYEAIRGADAALFLNPADVREVRRARAPGALAFALAPFIDARPFGARAHPGALRPRIVTVAMMRDGAKLASYRLLAAALLALDELPFDVVIVGDGPARGEVAALLAPLGDRVSFAGALDEAGVAATLRTCDVFAWPAIGEAIGIALLEAQACGLPVVAGASPGVAGVVADGRTGFLTAANDTPSFAAALRRLLVDAPLRAAMGSEAAAHVRTHHDLRVASARLDAILRDVVSARRPPAPPPPPPGLAATLP